MDVEIRKSALVAGASNEYRYWLRREWDDDLPPLVACMLNPSKADHRDDDPTITRQIVRAKKPQNIPPFGSLIVVNAFALRTPDPSEMIGKHRNGEDVVGPENDHHLERVFWEAKKRSGLIFVGWGGHIAFMPQRAEQIATLAAGVGADLHCLRQLKSGQPGHPLYVGYSRPFIRWNHSASA